MHASAPSSLDSATLARRLGELAGHEREVQVEFLLHLAEFDTRRAWAEAGHRSLWDYLLRVVHLREGAAFRRIAAMRVVRRLPVVAEALRDGRLCLSTVAVLEQLLTEANVGELVARAAFLTKAEVERLAVTLQPRTAPMDGLRLLPSRKAEPREAPTPVVEQSTPAVSVAAAPPAPAAFQLAPPPSRATLEPVTADTYSLRVTVDAALQKDIEELKALLSHKIPKGDVTAVVREAIQCALEKHRKRKGASEPSRKRKSPAAAKPAKKTVCGRQPISAAVRREVWMRDEGRCTWRGPDGRRRSGGPARSRTFGSSAVPITPWPRNRSSGGSTWRRAGTRRPGRVKLLPPAEVPAGYTGRASPLLRRRRPCSAGCECEPTHGAVPNRRLRLARDDRPATPRGAGAR